MSFPCRIRSFGKICFCCFPERQILLLSAVDIYISLNSNCSGTKMLFLFRCLRKWEYDLFYNVVESAEEADGLQLVISVLSLPGFGTGKTFAIFQVFGK